MPKALIQTSHIKAAGLGVNGVTGVTRSGHLVTLRKTRVICAAKAAFGQMFG